MEFSSVRNPDSYPIELRHIRALFLQKQHRRCITACRELLSDGDNAVAVKNQTLRRAFLRFYLALAHDELARTIHVYSTTKLTAIRLAEQLYRDATLSLPSAEQCVEAVREPTPAVGSEASQDLDPDSPLPHSNSNSISEGPQEPIYSPLSKRRSSDIYAPKTPPVDSPLATLSDQEDDLESHASYNQIMTPNRIPKLQRDYSSMSLVEPEDAPRPQSFMAYGERIAQQHPPTRPLYSGKSYTPSRLPRLNTTTSLLSSPVRKQLRTASEQTSPVISPVSPLGSESVASDASTISPISPSTPTAAFDTNAPDVRDTSRTKLQVIEDHITGLRDQVDRHIQLLEEEGRRVTNLQSERKAFRPSIGGGVSGQGGIPPLPASQIFRSFTPNNVKECEKRNRIATGRERGWQKERFNPVKYQRLAEMAMQEL